MNKEKTTTVKFGDLKVGDPFSWATAKYTKIKTRILVAKEINAMRVGSPRLKGFADSCLVKVELIPKPINLLDRDNPVYAYVGSNKELSLIHI